MLIAMIAPNDPRTAPKDGTAFLFINKTGVAFPVAWDAEASMWRSPRFLIRPEDAVSQFACWVGSPFDAVEAMAIFDMFHTEELVPC